MGLKCRGFTLAELLIALGILGVIATFTIPKILISQQNSKLKSITKEAATIASQAYQAYKARNTPTSSTGWAELIPYVNYINYIMDNSYQVDDVMGGGAITCTMFIPCYRLHSGAIIVTPVGGFGGTTATNYIGFWVDPDGTYNGVANGTGKSVYFRLYFNGRLDNEAATTPPWFDWN